jgi:Effector protein
VKIYNAAIHISPVEGMQLQNATAMSKADGDKYVEHVTKSLDRIQTTPTGRKIVSDLVSSGHRCTIFCAPSALTTDQNVCAKNPPSLANDIAAMPRPFRPRHKNLTTRQRENADVVDKFKTKLEQLGERYKKADVASELAVILGKAGAKYPDPRKKLCQRCGISTLDLQDMIMGVKAIDDNTYFTMCLVLYDFLTPGPGCDTSVRFQPYDSFKRDLRGDFDKLEVGAFEKKTNVWRNLMAVILGHELIHAWRIMIGKRLVFSGAWEEEAMTTGVGPFVSWSPTENSLRQEFSMPLRETYQAGSCASGMMAQIMRDVYSGVTVNERF